MNDLALSPARTQEIQARRAAEMQPMSSAFAWLCQLGILVPGNLTESEAAARIEAFAALLVRDFPAAAFCRSSLAHVAREAKFWPAYGELHRWLGVWCWDNLPRPEMPRIAPPPEREQEPEEVREAMRAKLRELAAELKAKGEDGAPPQVKRSRYPTPEQMEAMRDADPLVQRAREAARERAQAGGAVG